MSQVVKVIVTGDEASGKSAFLESITGSDVVSAELGMQFAQITVNDDLTLHLYGTLRVFQFDENLFSVLVRQLGLTEGFFGVVQMIDSTKPEFFKENAELLQRMYQSEAIPQLVVAANKQDMPGAMPLDELRVVLNVPEDIPLLPCVATDPKSAKAVLRRLLYSVVGELLAAHLKE